MTLWLLRGKAHVLLLVQGLPPMLLPYLRLSYTSDPDLLQRPGFFNAGPSSEYSEKLALAQLTDYLQQRLSRCNLLPVLCSVSCCVCCTYTHRASTSLWECVQDLGRHLCVALDLINWVVFLIVFALACMHERDSVQIFMNSAMIYCV